MHSPADFILVVSVFIQKVLPCFEQSSGGMYVKVEVDVLGSPSLIPVRSLAVKQH